MNKVMFRETIFQVVEHLVPEVNVIMKIKEKILLQGCVMYVIF